MIAHERDCYARPHQYLHQFKIPPGEILHLVDIEVIENIFQATHGLAAGFLYDLARKLRRFINVNAAVRREIVGIDVRIFRILRGNAILKMNCPHGPHI